MTSARGELDARQAIAADASVGVRVLGGGARTAPGGADPCAHAGGARGARERGRAGGGVSARKDSGGSPDSARASHARAAHRGAFLEGTPATHAAALHAAVYARPVRGRAGR